MKELKFRAWEFEAKEFIYLDPKDGFDTVWLVDDEQSVCQQFTGLKDKNGKEIYEGDILEDIFGNRVECNWFEWSGSSVPAMTGFTFRTISEGREIGGFEAIEMSFIKFAEIIGNIYENTELLTTTNPS